MKPTTTSRRAIQAFGVAAVLIFQIAAAHAASVLVDFGSDTTPTTSPTNGLFWNNITDAVGGSVADAIDANTGSATGIGVSISSRFNGVNQSGTQASNILPTTATQDSFYGNTGSFAGIVVPTAQLTITGLDSNQLYEFSMYASRGGVGDNRETQYVVTGNNSATAFLDAANNVDNIASVSGLAPDGSNQVVIDVSPGPNNTNGTGFFYLGALQITPIPEPSAAVFTLIFAGMMITRRRRSN